MVSSFDIFGNKVLIGMFSSYETSRRDNKANLPDMNFLFWVSKEVSE